PQASPVSSPRLRRRRGTKVLALRCLLPDNGSCPVIVADRRRPPRRGDEAQDAPGIDPHFAEASSLPMPQPWTYRSPAQASDQPPGCLMREREVGDREGDRPWWIWDRSRYTVGSPWGWGHSSASSGSGRSTPPACVPTRWWRWARRC